MNINIRDLARFNLKRRECSGQSEKCDDENRSTYQVKIQFKQKTAQL